MKVAFVGAGYMASEHLKAFAINPNVELVGIHSRSTERAEALAHNYPGLKVLPNVKSLYHETGADLVVIAVTELACESICMQAFRYPWKLLIEKPAGHNLEEATRIEQMATELNSKAYVALNRRFYGSTLKLQQALKGIDTQRIVTILDQEDTVSALAAGKPPEVVNNWMYANSIHLIDYFSQLCRGSHIKTHVLKRWDPTEPGNVIAQLEFTSGDIGLYQAVWNAPGPWSVSICTSPLRAELRPIEQLSLQKAGNRKSTLQPSDPLDQQFKPGLIRLAQAAVDATQGKAHQLPTIQEANKSMKIVESIYRTH